MDIKNKTSLKYINKDSLKVGKCYHVSSTVRNSIYDSRRAKLKCRLLTGAYILQDNRAAFNQYQVNPTCRLCSVAPKNRQRFIGECLFLNPERSDYILKKLLKYSALRFIPRPQIYDPEFLTRLTLDSSAVLYKERFDIDTWGMLELQTREYIHKIHHRRRAELKRLSVF